MCPHGRPEGRCNNCAAERSKGMVLRQSCIHLGPPTGRTIECSKCNGKVTIKLLSCTIHGECTPVTKVNDVKCCNTCEDHTLVL